MVRLKWAGMSLTNQTRDRRSEKGEADVSCVWATQPETRLVAVSRQDPASMHADLTHASSPLTSSSFPFVPFLPYIIASVTSLSPPISLQLI